MKPPSQNRTCIAFTMVELLVLIAVIAILAFLVLSALAAAKRQAMAIQCASNLKQVGLAFRVWEGENRDLYPMSFYTNSAGAPLYTNSNNMFRYFQVMSNELGSPHVLICPADKKRNPAANFNGDFNSSHISYFVALGADETYPQLWLTGDSNLTNGTQPINGLLEVTSQTPVGWTRKRHIIVGNIGMADGSVQQYSGAALTEASKNATNRLLMPP